MKLISQQGDTKVISASTTSASSAIAASGANALLVTHSIAGSIAFIAFGTSAPTATNADFPVSAYGGGALIAIPQEAATFVAVILDTGTGNVAVTPATLVNP